MKVYKQFTVGSLIAFLTLLPEDQELQGLNPCVDSYRGYYEHVAIEPGKGCKVIDLLDTLKLKLGTTMHGYKGGEYTFGVGCEVFVAEYGTTGPRLVGFTEHFEPIVMEDLW